MLGPNKSDGNPVFQRKTNSNPRRVFNARRATSKLTAITNGISRENNNLDQRVKGRRNAGIAVFGSSIRR